MSQRLPLIYPYLLLLSNRKFRKKSNTNLNKEGQLLSVSQRQNLVFVDWGEGSARRCPEHKV